LGKGAANVDEKFVRMWRLYLNASCAGFRYDGTRLYQILFSNGLNNDLPMTRDYMYREGVIDIQ